MIEVTEISDDQLSILLQKEENHFFDRKSKRIRPASLLKSLAAFANAEGGELIVGLEDTPDGGELWDGFDTIEDANGHIQAIDGIFPLDTGANISLMRHAKCSGVVMQIEVLKRREIVFLADKKVYVRRSARNHLIATDEEMQRLKLNKGIESFENQTVNIPTDHIENSSSIIKFMLEIVPDTNPKPWLRKQQLVVGEKPTVAGLLLFSDEPQIGLPKAAIKIYRYKTIEAEGTRETLEGEPLTIEGNAYCQIFGAVDRVLDITSRIPVVGEAGMENISFPQIALHEIIANAVLHRDYSLDDNVHIRIFDNRIEIESPGSLPGHITPQNILRSRSIRNKTLVRLINKFKNPPNKDVGEGLNTSFQAMRELKLRAPEIVQGEAFVQVNLRHERLGSSEELVVKYLAENEEINNSMARDLCAIGDANKMKRVFQSLMKGDVIERIPGRSQRNAAYRRGKNYSSE